MFTSSWLMINTALMRFLYQFANEICFCALWGRFSLKITLHSKNFNLLILNALDIMN